jgi:hypothetical protein
VLQNCGANDTKSLTYVYKKNENKNYIYRIDSKESTTTDSFSEFNNENNCTIVVIKARPLKLGESTPVIKNKL